MWVWSDSWEQLAYRCGAETLRSWNKVHSCLKFIINTNYNTLQVECLLCLCVTSYSRGIFKTYAVKGTDTVYMGKTLIQTLNATYCISLHISGLLTTFSFPKMFMCWLKKMPCFFRPHRSSALRDPCSSYLCSVYFIVFFALTRRVYKTAKSDYWLHVRLSVRPHWITRLPMEGYWWNFTHEIF